MFGRANDGSSNCWVILEAIFAAVPKCPFISEPVYKECVSSLSFGFLP